MKEHLLGELSVDTTWHFKAVCFIEKADTTLFMARQYEKKAEKLDREQKARLYCGRCTVKTECLADGLRLSADSTFLWGGFNNTERNRLRIATKEDFNNDAIWDNLEYEQKAVLMLSFHDNQAIIVA